MCVCVRFNTLFWGTGEGGGLDRRGFDRGGGDHGLFVRLLFCVEWRGFNSGNLGLGRLVHCARLLLRLE